MIDLESTNRFMERGARWFVRRRVGGEDTIKDLVEGASAAGEDATFDRVAESVARRAAARAAVTGAIGSPWMAVPLALVDLQGASAAEAQIRATAAFLEDPTFFERSDWDRSILLSMLNIDSEGMTGASLGVSAAKSFAVGRAKKLAVRTAANVVPIVGGLVGGVLEYVLLKRIARQVRPSSHPMNESDGHATPELEAKDLRGLHRAPTPQTVAPPEWTRDAGAVADILEEPIATS